MPFWDSELFSSIRQTEICIARHTIMTQLRHLILCVTKSVYCAGSREATVDRLNWTHTNNIPQCQLSACADHMAELPRQ